MTPPTEQGSELPTEALAKMLEEIGNVDFFGFDEKGQVTQFKLRQAVIAFTEIHRIAKHYCKASPAAPTAGGKGGRELPTGPGVWSRQGVLFHVWNNGHVLYGGQIPAGRLPEIWDYIRVDCIGVGHWTLVASAEYERLTDNRQLDFLQLLRNLAHELVPDYPFVKEDAFEWLWALTSSHQGTTLANDDVHGALAGLTQQADHLRRAREVAIERTAELEKHLAAMVKHCSNSLHGGPMEGMKDQNTRLKWYEGLMPIREAARAILSSPAAPAGGGE